MGMEFATYHKTSHLFGIMNSYAFWSDFREKQKWQPCLITEIKQKRQNMLKMATLF